MCGENREWVVDKDGEEEEYRVPRTDAKGSKIKRRQVNQKVERISRTTHRGRPFGCDVLSADDYYRECKHKELVPKTHELLAVVDDRWMNSLSFHH